MFLCHLYYGRQFLAPLNKVQEEEELLHCPRQQGHGHSQNVKVFTLKFLMCKGLTGELSCPVTGLVVTSCLFLWMVKHFSKMECYS